MADEKRPQYEYSEPPEDPWIVAVFERKFGRQLTNDEFRELQEMVRRRHASGEDD